MARAVNFDLVSGLSPRVAEDGIFTRKVVEAEEGELAMPNRSPKMRSKILVHEASCLGVNMRFNVDGFL